MAVAAASPRPAPVVELWDVLDRLRTLGPTGDPLVCAALLQATAALDGLALREVAAVEAHGTSTEVDLPSAAAVVQAATRCTVGAARATVRLAERLDGDLQPLGALLLAGRVTRAHCSAVVHGLRGLGAEVVGDAIEAVCEVALHADPVTVATELRLRAEAVSPELADEARRRLEARIGLSCDESPDGTGHLSATLHPETLALFRAVLDAQVHGAREQGDTRSVPRRRHDALVEVLRHAADCAGSDLPAQGGTRAQVTIIATAATLAGMRGAVPACLLGARHGLLTRLAMLRLLCDADVSTAHLSPKLDRVEMSRLTRTVTKAQWRALCARDRECVVAGCHRPPSQCQAHHVIHWANGGTSDLDNLVLLCHAHHHDVHDRQRWLGCTDGRTMTAAGWLDPSLGNPLRRPDAETVGSAAGGQRGGPPR